MARAHTPRTGPSAVNVNGNGGLLCWRTFTNRSSRRVSCPEIASSSPLANPRFISCPEIASSSPLAKPRFISFPEIASSSPLANPRLSLFSRA